MKGKKEVSVLKQRQTLATDPLEYSGLLLKLHRATTLKEFWKQLIALLNSFLPTHSVSLYFNYFDINSGFWALHDQNAPGSFRPWSERRKVSPTPAYLQSHVGKKIFGNEELLPKHPRLFKSEYFKKVMRIEGWHSLLCLAFWEEKTPLALLVIRKASEHGSFSPRETIFIESLYGHCQTVLRRLVQFQKQIIIQNSLLQSLHNLKLGMLILDESLTPIFKNQEALAACLVWNYGLGEAHKYDASKALYLPQTIKNACEKIRATSAERKKTEPNLQIPVFLKSPDKILTAAISLMAPKEVQLGRLYFRVEFHQRQSGEVAGKKRDKKNNALLLTLSAREKEVARAAAAGRSNVEIARQFGKTEATVKAQLLSVFHKLSIKRRSQLAALFI
ncbi:MAG: LuxR C-terminal-related transcriptional regulator [Chthoniobacterales bacterium]